MSTAAKWILGGGAELLIAVCLVAWWFVCEQRYFRKLRKDIPEDIKAMMKRGYLIRSDGSAITCLTCGMTSYNRNDVTNKYCGHCKKFHEG